jgi:hypothetical protein
MGIMSRLWIHIRLQALEAKQSRIESKINSKVNRSGIDVDDPRLRNLHDKTLAIG